LDSGACTTYFLFCHIILGHTKIDVRLPYRFLKYIRDIFPSAAIPTPKVVGKAAFAFLNTYTMFRCRHT
jgi:hypothetical protein